MTEYRPTHGYQGDDDPRYRWVNCNLDAWGMAVDKDSLGLVVPDPNRLRDWLVAHQGDTDGTTMAQGAAAVEACYGWSLDIAEISPAALWTFLGQVRGAVVHVVRQPLGDLFGATFDGTHGVYAQECDGTRILLFDTLGQRPIWVPWAKFVEAATQFGALIGHPGKVLCALTRPGRVEPFASVAKGTWWDYQVTAGKITSRKRRSTGGFSAATYKPDRLPWPALKSSRVLVQIPPGSKSAYAGRWMEPRAAGVRYVGEESI